MKQWKKSSRWRAARDKHRHNMRNSWRLACVREGTNPFRPVDTNFAFMWGIMQQLVLDQFCYLAPLPKNRGTTTVRFVKP